MKLAFVKSRALRGLAFLVCLGGCPLRSWADPVLTTLFSDHMVVQQGREIHVWGKADPGEKITVLFAGHETTANTDGHSSWTVHLPAMSAGGPFTLVIRGKKDITIKDVMVGEVWVASGQSNMAFSLDRAEGAAVEIPKADYPNIRLFTVPKKIAVSAQENTLPARWQICTPESAKSFSAVAYYFARELHRKLNVPIGIVESVWPGTPIEAWISHDALQSDASLKPVFDEWNHATPAQKHFAEIPLAFQLEFDDFELLVASADAPAKTVANFDDGSSRLTTGGLFSYSWADTTSTVFDLVSPGRGGKGLAARVSGQLDGTQDAVLSANYKVDGSTMDLTAYSGIRFWVRGNGSFRFRSKQPTITDYDD